MIGFIAFSMTIATVPPALQAAGRVTLEVNGQVVATDIPPSMRNGRVLVPIRWVAEALHADVQWDAEKRAVLIDTFNDASVAAAGNGRTIDLWARGRKLSPDVPPLIEQGRVLVSVRVAAEALGAEVAWVPEKRLVRITNPLMEIVSIHSFRFIEPIGWGFSRSGWPTNDERQRTADRFIDRLTVLLQEAEAVAPAALEQPVRRMDIGLNQWIDARGDVVNGGGLELVLSADGSLARIDTDRYGTGTMYVRLPSGELEAALKPLEAALPEPFPSRRLEPRTAPDAASAKDPAVLRLVAREFPESSVSSFAVDPVRNEYVLITMSRQDFSTTVWVSNDGATWAEADPSAFGNLQPSAVGYGSAESGVRLLSSSLDAGIYRSVDGGPWELVRAYPVPESNYKYPPIRFTADPANDDRMYAGFYHDTINPATYGVMLSEDGGRTWSETGVNGDPLLRFSFPSQLTFDPGQDGHLFLKASLSVYDTEFPVYIGEHLFESKDAGRNWTRLDGLNHMYGTAPGAQGAIYIGGKTQSGASYLVKSRDGGVTWEERKLPFAPYDIRFDPAAPDRLFAISYETDRTGLYVSSDGGATWSAPQPIAGTILHVDASRRLLFLDTSGGLEVYEWE